MKHCLTYLSFLHEYFINPEKFSCVFGQKTPYLLPVNLIVLFIIVLFNSCPVYYLTFLNNMSFSFNPIIYIYSTLHTSGFITHYLFYDDLFQPLLPTFLNRKSPVLLFLIYKKSLISPFVKFVKFVNNG